MKEKNCSTTSKFVRVAFFACLFFGCILVALMTSCATTGITNLRPTYLTIAPIVECVKDPLFTGESCRTFSVFPISYLDTSASLKDPIIEQQMLFILRNHLERLGYKFVPVDSSPDIVASLDCRSSYQSYYVPPQVRTSLQWIPGTTLQTRSTTSGTVQSGGQWGSWSGTGTATTNVPGHLATGTYTQPGYTSGSYYPSVSVWVCDSKSLNLVWRGTGTGTSDNPNFRVSSQGLINRMIEQFPPCRYAEENQPSGSGRIGVDLQVLTTDGNNYLPYIISLDPSGPAKKALLRQEDAIIAIDGGPTGNKPLSEVYKMLTGEAGTKVTLTIWRQGYTPDPFTREIVRVPLLPKK